MDNTQAMLMLLIAMPTLGRLNLVISICNYNYARPYGMGKAFAAYHSKYTLLWAIFFAMLPALYFGFSYLFLMGISIIIGLGLNNWVVKKLTELRETRTVLLQK